MAAVFPAPEVDPVASAALASAVATLNVAVAADRVRLALLEGGSAWPGLADDLVLARVAGIVGWYPAALPLYGGALTEANSPLMTEAGDYLLLEA